MKKLSFKVVNPYAAGVDVGSRFHLVAIGQDKDDVKKFGVYTSDHIEMVKWLSENKIRTIAMESTGSYWQTLFDALQKAGFNVILVNGNQVKNIKGKKTDVLDCLWIQKLHSLGLLSGSFLPSYHVQALRTYYNHRQYLIHQMSKYINKMQKALRLMNLRLDVAINDIMGQSGRAIIEAIIAGERDSQKLASLANYRVKKSKGEIAISLEGNWRDDLLFELSSCLSLHDAYGQKLKECDLELEKKIKAFQQVNEPVPEKTVRVKQVSKYSPKFDSGALAANYFGVDLMQIPGVSYNTVLCLLTQVGKDIYKFPTSKHFCSWLRLAPNNKITGGKIVSSRTPKGKNRLALALRQAANSIGNQKQGQLTSFFKKIAYKKDRPSAITATARKLATIIYNMIMKKQDYIIHQKEEIPDKIRNKMIKNIKTSVSKLKLSDEQIKLIFASDFPSIT
jgi:transposase